MEKNTGTCPGCRKRCDLATPRCHVGEAYARTGLLPGEKRKNKKDHRKNDEERRHRDAASEDVRLADTLRAVSRALRHGEGTLDALSAEEKAQLGELIEKAWAGMHSSQGDDHRGHHGHHEYGHHEHDHHGDHGHQEHRDGEVICQKDHGH